MDADYQLTLPAILMISTFVMFSQYFIVLRIQAVKAVKAGTRIKEDKFLGSNPVTATNIDDDKRWRLIVRNHLETVAFSLILLYLAVFVSPPTYSHSHLALIVFIPAYVFFRILYTICYANALQPWRSWVWFMANLCAIGGGIVGVVDAFTILQEQLDKGIENP